MMEPFKTLRSRVVPLLRDDVDTDQVIPARFLKVISKHGLGVNLFADWRYDDDGSPKPDFILNKPEHAGAQVLFVGINFGCGSSREHAPWALTDWGFRAVIALSFADIFRGNALKNGLVPIEIDPEAHASLREQLVRDPAAEIELDVASRTLRLPDGTAVEFPIDTFSVNCLLEGTDQLGYLMSFEEQISAYEAEVGGG